MDSRDALRVKLLKKAKEQINQKFAGREIHIIKAVNLLSDLDSVGNLLKENASEWKLRKPTGDAEEAFTELEKNSENIEEEKKSLTEFIEKEMKEEFPNFSVLATPVLGAKLLSAAGSKKRLAFMPASTIQVLGAEKALFAHLRRNAKSPKHGHLFNHPLMQKLPRVKRGKVARIIAGKLSIALKQDYFNGENNSSTALKELEEQIATVAAEPITAKQQEKEKELIAQHETPVFDFKKEFALKAKQPEANRTWTPEERRAYFAKNSPPRKETAAPQENRRENYIQKERPFNREKRFNERPSFRGDRRSSFGERKRFDSPRRERSFGERDSSYSPRPRNSFRTNRRESFGERRERPFMERRDDSFGEKRFEDRPRRFGDKPNYAERTRNSEKRSTFSRTKNKSFGKGRFNKPKHQGRKY